MSVPLYLGIDGGGRKTLAVVGDDRGNILGKGRSGPSNHFQVGLEAAVREILAAVDEARESAPGGRAGGGSIRVAAFCLSGADRPLDHTRLEQALRATGVAPRISVLNDGFAVLRAGTAAARAIAVVAGTGINAVGLNEGRRAQLPALGRLSGDWGGTDDLAREALALVMRAHDGRGEPTALSPLVLAALGAPSVEWVLDALWERQLAPDDLGLLVPPLLDAANAGDEPARRVVERLADELAVSARAIAVQLDLPGSEIPVVFGGGTVRRGGSHLEAAVRRAIARTLPAATASFVHVEPAHGAYLLALDSHRGRCRAGCAGGFNRAG